MIAMIFDIAGSFPGAATACELPPAAALTCTTNASRGMRQPVAGILETHSRVLAPRGEVGRARKAEPARVAALLDRSTHCLLARAAIDALTQQIGVADVAGILLDKMDDDVARLDLLAVDDDRRVEVEVGVDTTGMRDLTAPGVPRFGHDLVVGHGLVEVQAGSSSVR